VQLDPGYVTTAGVVAKWYKILYHFAMEEKMAAVTASEARQNLFPLIERVNADRTAIEITHRHGNAVLISKAEYDALAETAHVLRCPANAERLLESISQALKGERSGHFMTR
jgi:antitoxin YefM